MTELLDNFALNVRAVSRESFTRAIELALAAAPGGTVSHWCEHSAFGLVLFWHADAVERFKGSPVHALPCTMGPSEAADFAWIWLSKADRKRFSLSGMDAEYNDDVFCEKAFRVFVEDWGRVGGHPYSAAAILPVWAWLGK